MNLLALVTDGFGGQGGIARYNCDLVTAMAQCGEASRIVVVPRQGRAPPSILPLGVRQREPPATKPRYVLTAARVAIVGGPFDAIFCGHLHLAPLAAIIAGLLRVPLWAQLHGGEAWERLAPSQLWAVRRATLITAVSRHTRRRFLQLTGIEPSRVRVLPNTVGEGFTPGPRPDYLLDRHRLRGKKILLTVGRLAADERRKGHDKVIRALPGLITADPDLVYLIVGEGDDRARLEELARQNGVADRVLFVGRVELPELADYYRLADVFVMPSTQEGFGIVFLEAAATGLRLVGGNRDGSIDALADGAVGLAIDPGDPQELVRAIRRALAAGAPDPAQVRRYRFDNFAGLVGDLTKTRLLRPVLQ
jgi:phosphatidylinositol alpha-1,6-mannosyltransferase